MKKTYQTLYSIAFFTSFLVATFFISSCNQPEKPTATSIPQNNNFKLTALLDRDKNLSYDEFLKLKDKYGKLKMQYNADPSNFAALLKFAEIYIYEARVSGEHPYYYTAALETLDVILTNNHQLTKDQQFTALFYKATVQLSQHNFIAKAFHIG